MVNSIYLEEIQFIKVSVGEAGVKMIDGRLQLHTAEVSESVTTFKGFLFPMQVEEIQD